MADLLACPFCRELFTQDETDVCPACGLVLSPLAKLPVSEETLAVIEEEWQEKPDYLPFNLLYWRRSRGVLFLTAIAGLLMFFAPWVNVTAPDYDRFTGADMARQLPWVWACPVAWGMLAVVAASRRSVATMRGARVVAALFCAIPAVTILVIIAKPPSSNLIPVRYDYEIAFFATALLGLVGLPFGVTFGGKSHESGRSCIDDV